MLTFLLFWGSCKLIVISVDPSEQHSLRVHQRTPPEQRPRLANQLLFRTWTLAAAVNSYNVFIIYPFTLIVSFSHHTFTNSVLDYWYPGQCKLLSCFVELSYYILVQCSIVVFWHYIVCHYLLFFFLRDQLYVVYVKGAFVKRIYCFNAMTLPILPHDDRRNRSRRLRTS